MKVIWSCIDRELHIKMRDLKAIRSLQVGTLGEVVSRREIRKILVKVGNKAVVQITNRFVSASSPRKRELRD